MRTVSAAIVHLACLSALLCSSSAAQNLPIEERGLKPYGSYEGGNLDSINMANGSLTLHIPFWSYPQRGGKLRLNYFINFTSNDWDLVTRCGGVNGCRDSWWWMGNCELGVDNFCGTGGIKIKTDQGLTYQQSFVNLSPGVGAYSYRAVQPSGAVIQLAATSTGYYRSIDGSGILFLPNTTMWERDGTYGPPDTPTQVPGNWYDSNGNYMTATTSVLSDAVTDTVGRAIPAQVTTTDPNDLAKCDNAPLPVSSATVWNLPAPYDQNAQTSTAKIILCSVTFHVHRDAFDAGSGDYPFDANKTFIQNIVLPNGTKWKFEYQANEGNVSKITLPTGGSISYAWQTFTDSCSDSVRFAQHVVTRTVDPGDGTSTQTWNYQLAIPGMIVTDPQGNDTVYTITAVGYGTCSRYETQGQTFQGPSSGNVLLKTVQTQYVATQNLYDYNSAASVFPSTVTTVFPNGASTVQRKVVKQWDPGIQYCGLSAPPCQPSGSAPRLLLGELVDDKEYDYGTNASGSLLRETVNTYLQSLNSLYLTNNMLDLLSSVQVKNGSGAQVSYTTSGYDESAYPLQSSGITTQHGAPPNSSRGNQTSANHWLNTTGGYLASHNYFYDTGTIQQAIDPGTHTTTYTYSSTFAGAYPIQTQLNDTHSPDLASHISLANYDFNGGVVLSTTDENGRATNYLYDLLSRPRQITYPDIGEVDYTYNDSLPSSTSPSVTISQKITSSLNNVKLFVVDGLGRLTHVQHTSDPEGITYVDTTYDELGRKASATNPYRSATGESTNGTTQYKYDALGRTCVVIPPDGTAVTGSCPTTAPARDVFTQYAGNCTTVTDEAGKSRKSCADGLGRVTQLNEDPSGLNYATNYQYDALGNLTCVEQHGAASASGCSGSSDVGSLWRIRRFTYDSVSRLLTAKNPETGNATSYGNISYTYDPDGNVLTKTSPAPNQTGAATITTNYAYDEIHRLKSETYTGITTPAVYYGYDNGNLANLGACATAPPTFSPVDANPKPYRTSMCDGSGAAAWTHDQMGRPKQDRRIAVGSTNNTKTFTYTYNLDGSEKTLQYPSGRTITYTPGGAGRPLEAKDITNTINYVTAATYAPQGVLSGFTNQATIQARFTYNPRLQPLQIFYGTNGIPSLTGSTCPAGPGNIMHRLYDFHLGAGDNGNVNSIANCRDTMKTANYLYDSLNRITSGSSSGNWWGDTYVPDAWGNLTNMNPITGKTNTQNLQAAPASWKNQLNGHCHDTAGNLLQTTSCPSQPTNPTYVYDAENRLVGTAGFTYVYDGDGRRIKKCSSCSTGSGGTLYWTGMGTDNLVESNLAGTLTFEYIFFNGKRVARRNGTTNPPNYYFADYLGSMSVVTSSAGAIQDDSDYFPYGGEIPYLNNLPQNYKFTGKERDAESNLDELGARYYASSLGRFMTPDWAAKAIAVPYANFANPQSLNLYSYVGNNPTTLNDPDGHDQIDYNCMCAPTEATTDGHPIRDTLALGAYTISSLLAPGSGTFLRNLLGLGLANAPQVQKAAEALADIAAPPGTPSFSVAGAAANFGFQSFETAGSVVGGELKGGGSALVSFSKEASEFGVRISAVGGPAGTLSRLEAGAINAAKGEGASSLNLTATMVKDSMARLLRQNGFVQELRNGKATGNWIKVIKIKKE